MKTLIYDNYNMLESEDTEKELKENIAEREEIEITEVTEEMLEEEKSYLYNDYFDDELNNLDLKLNGRVIAIADLGLWNGRKQGYRICENNLKEIMTVGNHDYIEIWGNGYNVYKNSSHHDGTNRYLFREIREDRNIDHFLYLIVEGKKISRSVLNYYTKGLYKYVKQIYGK